MNNTTHYDINFNSITRGSGKGNRDSSLHNIIRGKNWLGGAPSLPILKENTGLVFIAPPDLNLHPANIGHIREFSPLLTENPYSLGATIRDMLDPRAAMSRLDGSLSPNSILNEPRYPFVSLLDNTLISLDGWPDYVIEEFVGAPGKQGSTVLHAKGRIKKGQHFTLNATHMNLPGDAINQIYSYLALWMDHVHRWSVSPYLANIRNNRLDYVMRIYRFALDSTGTRVNQFTMSGYGFPRAGSQGAVMDYNIDSSVNAGYDTISAAWSNVGVFHNDPIVLLCFNMLVERFNPLMKDGIRENQMVKVGAAEGLPSLAMAEKYQYYGFPRINLATLEFEVWVDKKIYSYLSEGFIPEETLGLIAKNRDDSFDALWDKTEQEVKDAITSPFEGII